MHELAPGVWHWKAPHPQWEPTEPWDQNVSSYAIDDGERLLLFDPLSVPPEIQRLAVDGEAGQAHSYSAGDHLPVGVQAFPGQKHNDVVLWIESHRAVVAGDTLADFGEGPQINPRWLGKDVTREQVVDGLRPLLALPVE